MGIIDKLIEKPQTVNYEELVWILKNNALNEKLFEAADYVRKRYLGDEVFIRGIIEFSNYCRKNCLYCGIRAANKCVKRYRMSECEIIDRAKLMIKNGVKTIVLQSGEDPFYMPDIICNVIENIKKYDVAITLSLGEWPEECYRLWKDAGADRYLMRHETASKELYRRLHPGSSFEERKKHLYILKSLNYEIGAGCIVGLPGQKEEDLALDLIFTREIDADMVGIGPFIPHPNTPLKDEKKGDLITCLKMIALTRLLIPTTNIPATTAIGTLHIDGRKLALKCGANVIMPNMTPMKYRRNYELYPGKKHIFDDDSIRMDEVKEFIKSAGRIPSKSKGFRMRRGKDELLRDEHTGVEQKCGLQIGKRNTS